MKGVRKHVWIIAVAVLSFCFSTQLAMAGSAASNFTVSAAVVATCSISTVNMNFGNYDPINANASTALDVNGSVTITCTKGASTWIDLSPGANAANAVGTTRAMATAGPDYLSYELYQDNTHTTVWGVGNPGNALVPPVAPNKNARTFTVYGRIPAGQGSSVGNYTDTVTATVNF
ncbi:MAG TPA: spore coat U domain-containing protein [Nitrospira sp.]|nr:spore coat U domain-containing protein [Nitrospira sp.]